MRCSVSKIIVIGISCLHAMPGALAHALTRGDALPIAILCVLFELLPRVIPKTSKQPVDELRTSSGRRPIDRNLDLGPDISVQERV